MNARDSFIFGAKYTTALGKGHDISRRQKKPIWPFSIHEKSLARSLSFSLSCLLLLPCHSHSWAHTSSGHGHLDKNILSKKVLCLKGRKSCKWARQSIKGSKTSFFGKDTRIAGTEIKFLQIDPKLIPLPYNVHTLCVGYVGLLAFWVSHLARRIDDDTAERGEEKRRRRTALSITPFVLYGGA